MSVMKSYSNSLTYVLNAVETNFFTVFTNERNTVGRSVANQFMRGSSILDRSPIAAGLLITMANHLHSENKSGLER